MRQHVDLTRRPEGPLQSKLPFLFLLVNGLLTVHPQGVHLLSAALLIHRMRERMVRNGPPVATVARAVICLIENIRTEKGIGIEIGTAGIGIGIETGTGTAGIEIGIGIVIGGMIMTEGPVKDIEEIMIGVIMMNHIVEAVPTVAGVEAGAGAGVRALMIEVDRINFVLFPLDMEARRRYLLLVIWPSLKIYMET